MPSLQDLITGAGAGVDYLQRRSATGNAVNTLTSGANTAIDTLAGGARDARDVYSRIYGDQKATLSPYLNFGAEGMTRLMDLMKPGGGLDATFGKTYTPPNLSDDPGFKFRLGEGIQEFERSASARGVLGFGGSAKALERYRQNFAANEYAAADARSHRDFMDEYGIFRNNQADQFSRLRDLTQVGQNAAGQSVAAGSDYGARVGQTYQDQARSTAELQQQISQAIANGDFQKASELSKLIGTGVDMAKQFLPGAGAAAAVASIPGGTAPAAGAVGGATGLGTLASAALPFAPLALGVGMSIAGSQLHRVADQWTPTQTDFDQKFQGIQDPAQKAALARDYLQQLYKFGSESGGKTKIAQQALDSFVKAYGDPQQYGVSIKLPQNTGAFGFQPNLIPGSFSAA